MTTDTPEPWAMDEARRRAGAPPAPYNDGSLTALAHMIQRYEKPPIAPDVLRARSLVAGVLRAVLKTEDAQKTEDGDKDNTPALQAVLAALREPRAPSPTVSERVEAWYTEWDRAGCKHWADSITWSTARKIAKRLDEQEQST